MLQALANKNGRSLGSWRAHSTSLVHMARGGNYVFTLSADGGIRGWHVASTTPLDAIVESELTKRADLFTQQQRFKYALILFGPTLMFPDSLACINLLTRLKHIFWRHS